MNCDRVCERVCGEMWESDDDTMFSDDVTQC